MTRAAGLSAAIVAAALTSCGDRSVGTVALGEHQPASVESIADQSPVAINPVTPMTYPPALLEQGIEGRVLLRLFVDAQGTLIPGRPAWLNEVWSEPPSLRLAVVVAPMNPISEKGSPAARRISAFCGGPKTMNLRACPVPISMLK